MVEAQTDPDYRRFKEELADAWFRYPSGEKQRIARRLARRGYARRGVRVLGVGGGILGISFPIVALESVGAIPAALNTGLRMVGALVATVFAALYGWVVAVNQFFSVKDRLVDPPEVRAVAAEMREPWQKRKKGEPHPEPAWRIGLAAAQETARAHVSAETAQRRAASRPPAPARAEGPAPAVGPVTSVSPARTAAEALRAGRVSLVKHRSPKSGQSDDPRLPRPEPHAAGRRAERNESPVRKPRL
ncbi:hypothetical protein LG943_01400 [Streptomonospora sp. S1-112]|uniref:Uncharacterized protein n=1 Tax=Streptomonospora mangrovi TaxID=2883123 RepID=A0A9X3NGG6_9ACTN|nr:hypothetical protein [Streptomonospora mangrovi]MDA0562997.1 hypothetical protein [Streptomonospora mangrovi]